ncbi:VOC family protein [Kitasatospora sp. GP82]|uniref:VOC family protein n=1 Tax=Kitasatospora sp. GP82 TaxID=3035089 RepID=UPI002474AB66|nr:VOC family protein [Kitasatospora sp. GP82]MDH6128362.1 catechol-2,3-dioxygenase [Kitasatospora sp. GP82]
MVLHVRHVGLGVPDLRSARNFYENYWKLEVVEADGDRLYFGAGCPESHVLRLRATEEARVDVIAFAAESPSEVDRIAERVAHHPRGRLIGEPGVRQDLGGGYAVRFLDCDGRTVEVSADVRGRVFRPVEEAETRPKSIGHVVLNTIDLQGAREFYESVLGFMVTDWVEDVMCFLRSGRAHHIIAFTRAPHASLNHVAFEMRGLDEFMRATGSLMRAGIAPVWGPGRHGVGQNTFSYFQEPSSGFVLEYTTAAQLIDDEHGWTPKVYPADAQTTDVWGTANARDEAVSATLIGRPDPGLWSPPPV